MNQDNLKDLLLFLNFTQHQNVFIKKFSFGDYSLSIDFENKTINYPEDYGLKVNERQTCNFASNENFVVFECVHRLLEKGYKPEHIELEPKWKLGHGASGGRADIMVKNHQNQPFLIIECKTFDREFNKAWKDTLEDGGQLFSYVEQEKSVEFICLYASQWNERDKKVDDQQRIISVKDNPIILKDLPEALHYSNAKNVKERFKAWKETYQLEATEKGIFEDNIQAYQIGKDKYTLAIDTQPINSLNIKGKYHEFRTILRKHNVSRRENAFEVLVNLFLCKIVDETQNPEDLHFYWKGMAYDSYFDLVDRLQKLYKIGMQQFLQQDIIYVSQDDIDGAFWAIKQKPNATEQRIKELFQQLKFYKGLDFEFIKVSNKEKFEKNAKILIEIIQMWQGLRLTSTEENQFLGDMFEYFLDNGIKQSEGQFFTPIPICKFIVSALPLESMLQQHSEPLKVIDYACGSGHFLNEYGSQVSKLLKPIKDIDEPNSYYAQTYGIEKEDRLAKVSKVASFMYGRNEINIIDADALISHENIKPESFDVLVANPPFAVEDFLQTIDEVEREKFKLFNLVNNPSNNNIQCFFLERAQHLLAPDSVMGVIVPSSILSNSDSIHIATREILLQYFDFLSIVELGSQTFGKTGTNTVVLFLRRKAQRPEQAVQFKNRVNNFFADWDSEKVSSGGAYLDIKVVEKYCQHIQVDFALYESLLKGELNHDLLAVEFFKDYKTDFYKRTEIVNLKKQKQFKAKSELQQQAELDARLLSYLTEIEKDKLYYFMLTQYNASLEHKARPLLVVKSPSDNKEQKKFLGYEWSSAKGNEGLSYIGGETVFDINTPLFDPKNRDNSDKISYVIRQNFNGEQLTIPEHLTPFVTQVYLHDVLDFSRKDFNKAFNLSAQSKVEIETRWDSVRILQLLCKIGGSQKKIQNTEILLEGSIPVVTQEKGNLIAGFVNDVEPIQDLPLIVFGDHSCTFKYVDFPFVRGADGTQLLKVDPNIIDPKYFYYILNVIKIRNSDKYERHFKYLAEEKIPLPPLEVQQKIVEECEVVDLTLDSESQKIVTAHEKIKDIIENAKTTAIHKFKIGQLLALEYGKSLPEAKRIAGEVPVMGSNGISGYHNESLCDSPAVIVGRKGSAGKVTYIERACFPIDTTFYVKPLIESNMKFIYYLLNSLGLEKSIVGIGVPGINRNDIYQLEVPNISYDEQVKIIQKIEALEMQIAQAQQVIDAAPQQKQAILQKYL
ncbi:N-6 DNA methylase [Acinetobacter sp. YH01003]|uniref:N-6 DNA methylase n=1 Tax=Acinetobacter sp. YH01003 TaxID=2601019 RepID=UPI0015D30CAE|nr:N-6 DNA methylase [Acinetobacter sp. YH01003]